MYVCMYVCMYVYIYVYIYVYTYADNDSLLLCGLCGVLINVCVWISFTVHWGSATYACLLVFPVALLWGIRSCRRRCQPRESLIMRNVACSCAQARVTCAQKNACSSDGWRGQQAGFVLAHAYATMHVHAQQDIQHTRTLACICKAYLHAHESHYEKWMVQAEAMLVCIYTHVSSVRM